MHLVTVDKRHSYELVLAEFHPFRKVTELLFNQPCENYFDLAPEKFNTLYSTQGVTNRFHLLG
jgi:hypothetical protein